ncbi:MAG TPA: hypothetical protein VLS92_08985 [Acidimicrobiia bacterium]|nr:hypothetical protein [Acidimicrobiia bacterium]
MAQHEHRIRLRDRRLLLALSVGLPLAEVFTLGLLDIPSGFGLAAQVTAAGPFGVFHDLRWLFVFHNSVAGFIVGLLLLVAFRSVLLALLVRSAWPGPPPGVRRLLGHALVSTLVAAVFLSPWVTLLFGAAIIPLSWVFFGALPPAIFTILILHHMGIDGGWWRRLPPARSAAWMGLSFLALSLSALAVAGRPLAVVLGVVAVAGLFNAWAWHHLVADIVIGLPARSRRLAPVTVLAALAVFLVAAVGSQIGFGARADQDPGVWVAGDARQGVRAVLLVGGFASGCCDEGPKLQAESDAMYVQQFSYLGRTEEGDPLPHSGLATDADISLMARLMAAQVEGLAEQSGRPVAVVAESEGTLVVSAYLQEHLEAPVDRLMLLSPIIEPGRVTFPDPGEEGWGMVAGYQLRALSELIDEMAPFTISADSALVASVRREAADLQEALLGDYPRIEEVAVLPLADAVTGPGDGDFPIEVIVVPGFHGGLRGRPDVQAMIRSWVLGGDLEGSGIWLAVNWVIAGSASAWQVPALDLLSYPYG